MPSDNKKARAQKKKEAMKTKHTNKKETEVNGTGEAQTEVPVTTNGNGNINTNKLPSTEEELLVKKLEHDMELNAQARSCTGVLGIHPRSRDIKIDNFSVTFHGAEILSDTRIELNCGRRYGLIGANGAGMYFPTTLFRLS